MLVKNLRGVLLFEPSDEKAWKRIDWLKKRFRYRNLGIIPSIYNNVSNKLFKTRVFRKLYYPIKEYELFSKMFIDIGFNELFVESIVFSSIYISPLMLLSNKYLDIVEKYSIETINICRELSIRDWKLHLRIADYTILDSYEETVQYSIEYLENIDKPSVSRKVFEERRKLVERDSKRYWRIKCSEGQNIFLHYLDPLLLVREYIDKIRNRLSINYAAALAVIPVINLTILDTST